MQNMKKIQCPVLNNGVGSFWFGMVLVGYGFINCLASESFVVTFSQGHFYYFFDEDVRPEV